MAKRPTRAAAAAKRPAASRTTKKPTAAETPAAVPASLAGARAEDAAHRAKGRATGAAKTAAAKAKATAAKAPAAETKPASAKAKMPAARGATASAKSRPAAAEAPARGARGASGRQSATARAAAPKRGAKTKPTKVIPPYLAAELGQPVDHEGEPIGAGSRAAFADTELQRYTLQLWQQMQSRRGVNLHLPAMERAGVTIDQIWTTGVTDRLTTSSTADEVRRYRQKLLFRANLLESILTETVSELNRLESVEPAPPRSPDQPG